jgi:hypothetical protein
VSVRQVAAPPRPERMNAFEETFADRVSLGKALATVG